jgi:hypothetical protein
MTKEEFRQQIFLELLRSYHDGIGVTHAAEPQDEVGEQLAREADVIVRAYYREIPA